MNIGFITTSRADFGIYLPLLKKMQKDKFFKIYLFAGGMHMDKRFGNSYKAIEKEGFKISEKITSLVDGYEPQDVSKSIAKTIGAFSEVWKNYHKKLDLVFALGDRFEMFAACTASVPFGIKIAHLHGGETTLGAIDDKFRHAISCMASVHFTSNKVHAKRVSHIIGNKDLIYNVGALGVEGALKSDFYSKKEFLSLFKFNINRPFILTTIHPETVKYQLNNKYIAAYLDAIKNINLPVLCTLANADTGGDVIRKELLKFESENPDKIKCVENLGQKGYFTAMRYCHVMIGNTSSGIIEAAVFRKGVINLGDRQKGRQVGKNVIHVPFDANKITGAFKRISKWNVKNIFNSYPYGNGETSSKIIRILKKLYGEI